MGDHGAGAFTGSPNVEMLVDVGVSHVILGHSERRAIFGECSKLIGKKAGRALENPRLRGVIACVGETLEERKAGDTGKVVLEQLAQFAAHIKQEQWARMVVAYEPVWAIGTGVVASPEDAQTVHAQIRAWLSQHVSPAVAAATRLIYGGSVKAVNCAQLAQQPDIDWFLVGGASLDPKEFIDIISNSEKKTLSKI